MRPLVWILPSLLPLAACGAEPQGPVSAVLITLDTTNPGALDVYGRDRGLTPELKRFAAECVTYERARTVAPLTLVAHTSMLTGLYPPRHTVRDNGHLPLPDSAETLAEYARAAGHRTAAFVSALVLAAPYGLDQGFDTYDQPSAADVSAESGIAERGRWPVTLAAKEWLDTRREGEPFFLWVHYFDPHEPYQPPPKHLQRAGGQPYLGEVSAVDEAVGDLLARLRAEPDYADMLIVVAGDHGESRGRHGELTHSLLAYDATLRVPLLVRYGDGRRGGEHSDEIVSVVDVFATLLGGMGCGQAHDVDGLNLGGEPVPRDRGVYFEDYLGYLNYGWSPLAGWADGEAKYLHGTDPELFALEQDPGEEHNLFSLADPRVQRARAAIDRVSRAPALIREQATESAGLDGPSLRGLGYGGAASVQATIPHPLEVTGLPAPRARLAEYEIARRAPGLAASGKRDEAIRDLRELIAANPRHAVAHDLLGQYLIEAGRPAEALVPLQAMLELGLDRSRLRRHLASACSALGRFDQALEHLRRAEELRPGDDDTRSLRERIERRLQRVAPRAPGGR